MKGLAVKVHAAILVTVLFGAMATVRAEQRVPFPVDWTSMGDSSLDLSRFLDAPAGKHGFIRPQKDHLVDGSGKRFRIWGVNLGGPACFPEKQQAERLADTLAALGINCVRFHGLDSAWGKSSLDRSGDRWDQLNEADLAKFDYLFDQLRRRGIYANLNLNVFRTYGPADEVPQPRELGLGKWATHFHPRLIQLQQDYARKLLTRTNPYTGRRYCEEPAVVVVEIVNENSLVGGWLSGRLVGEDDQDAGTWSPLPTKYAAELNRQFNRWLAENRSPEQRLEFEMQAGRAGPLTLLSPDQFAGVSRERFETDYQFIVQTERKFLSQMRSFLKDQVGLKSMLIGDSDHSDTLNGYPHMLNNAMFDYMDGHGYWQHPSTGTEVRIKNDPMVNDPSDSTIVQFARTAMVGKPFVISETQHPYPHQYAAEGMPIVTAYSMLQDWDGVCFHAWGSSFYDSKSIIERHELFQLSPDPIKVATLWACGLMWHQRVIRPATEQTVRNVSAREMVDWCRVSRWDHRPFFDPLFPKTLPLVQQTRWQYVGDDEVPSADYPAVSIDNGIRSEGGQLDWLDFQNGRGHLLIQSPMAEAIVGFQSDWRGKAWKGTHHLSTDLSNDFAVVMLVSLDGQPIQDSRQLLLLAADRAVCKGLTWHDDMQTVDQWGDGPVEIRPVIGKVSIKGWPESDNLNVRILGAVGQPTGEQWMAELRGDRHMIDVGSPAGIMAIVERNPTGTE
ncbi:hypothetical protein [Crateriforma conspicua]|nr:hypothetical protein [Crateriforma conspicua]